MSEEETQKKRQVGWGSVPMKDNPKIRDKDVLVIRYNKFKKGLLTEGRNEEILKAKLELDNIFDLSTDDFFKTIIDKVTDNELTWPRKVVRKDKDTEMMEMVAAITGKSTEEVKVLLEAKRAEEKATEEETEEEETEEEEATEKEVEELPEDTEEVEEDNKEDETEDTEEEEIKPVSN